MDRKMIEAAGGEIRKTPFGEYAAHPLFMSAGDSRRPENLLGRSNIGALREKYKIPTVATPDEIRQNQAVILDDGPCQALLISLHEEDDSPLAMAFMKAITDYPAVDDDDYYGKVDEARDEWLDDNVRDIFRSALEERFDDFESGLWDRNLSIREWLDGHPDLRREITDSLQQTDEGSFVMDSHDRKFVYDAIRDAALEEEEEHGQQQLS